MPFYAIVISIFLINSASGLELIQPESGDHCKDQIFKTLDYIIGEDYEIISMIKEKSHKTNGVNGRIWYWIKTNACDGHFIAVHHNMFSSRCKAAHYISVPKYLNSIFAKGECKEILPQTLYPTKEIVRGHVEL